MRVLVGMSGGVDSTVTALLLRQQGYEVVGITLNLWSYAGRQESYNDCCSLAVIDVARELGIEHHFADYGQLFKEQVVEHFIREYARGRTPNPCTRCNALIRFPMLLREAERHNCDYIATGHHARIAREDGVCYLLRGRDPEKDQSYFLYGLTQQELCRTLLPIGERTKQEIYKIAREHGLQAARRPESQDLCFIPDGDYRRFLDAYLEIEPGEIVDIHGRVLGEHEGLPFYTIGQRHGLGLRTGERLYVVALDAERNRVIVGPEEELYATGLIAREVNWPAGPPVGSGLGTGIEAGLEVVDVDVDVEVEVEVEVKIRYRSPSVRARLRLLSDNAVELRFVERQRAVTPGQIAVFYRGERLLGGGVIDEVLRS